MRPVFPYLITVGIVAAFTVLKLFANHALKIESPLLLFYSAVITAAWLGGFVQGVFAAILALLAAQHFFVFPVSSPLENHFRMGLFLVDCIFIVAFAWTLHRSRRRAHLALSEATSAQRASDLSEARFRKLFESNMIGLIFTKGEGQIVDANDYFLNILGYSREDLAKGHLNWVNFTPPEHLPKSRQNYELMRRDGVTPPFEKAYRRKDGSTVQVLVGAAALDDEKAVKFVLDITERKKTEKALAEAYSQLEERVAERTMELRQSQNFLDSVIENIPNMLFVKDAKDLRFVRFNKAGETLLGYERTDLLGKNDYDFFPKEEADFFVEKDRAVLRGGAAVDIPEEPLSTRTGVRILHTKKIPILDKNGIPQYLLGISEDVTERKLADQQRVKLAQEQVARAEAEKIAGQLRFLAEVSASLTESLDPKIMLDSFARIVIGQLGDWCVIDLMSEDEKSLQEPIIVHRDTAKVKVAQAFRRERPVQLDNGGDIARAIRSGRSELISEVEDGQSRPELLGLVNAHSAMIIPFQSYGKILGTMTLISAESMRRFNQLDVSLAIDVARRASFAIDNAGLYAKAQEASRAKSAFLANMSHEIRTPLGAMLGFTELLADDGLDPTQRQYLSTIAKNGQHLLRIVDEILDLSKVESDHVHVENIEFSLGGLLTEIFTPLRLQAREKGLIFNVAQPQLPERVITDPTRLRQILINVIGNAIKFTHEGSINVVVSAEESARAPGRQILKVAVTDTGIGITAEQRDRLFQPFQQADNSMTRRFGGTGLGLFLSRRLAQLLGGNVVLEDSSERGSRFMVTASMEVRSASAAKKPQTAPAPATGETVTVSHDGSVLIVDDAPDNRTLIYHYVSRLGYFVDVAATGAEGVEKTLTGKFDVVLMDVQMPEMDGFEAVKILRERGHEGPIVALTAHTMKGDRERCLANGFTDYLGKPIDRDQLRKTLSKYISQNKEQPQ